MTTAFQRRFPFHPTFFSLRGPRAFLLLAVLSALPGFTALALAQEGSGEPPERGLRETVVSLLDDLLSRRDREAGESDAEESGPETGSQTAPEEESTSSGRVEILPEPVGRAAQLPPDPPPPRPSRPSVVLTAPVAGQASARPSASATTRDDRASGSASPSRPATRDHRTGSSASSDRPAVRDHRAESADPSSSASRPPVRDHRGDDAGDPSPPRVRDHRLGNAATTPPTLLTGAVLKYGLSDQVRDQGGRGASREQVDLLAGWLTDPAVALDEAEVVPFSRVFRDQSSTSGLYYFQPRVYRLAWDDGDGLALRMLYQAASEGAGEVLVRMTLDAGLDPRELEVARALLAAQKARGKLQHFTELLRVPIDEAPEVRIAEDLEQLFDIPADRVRASGVSDSLGRLDVALATDSVTKENLQLALIEGGGLGGRVILAPSGGQLGPQHVPFLVDPTDERTYPRLYWQPGSEWVNPYPYSARLRWLHVLRLVGNRPVVYSWKLGDASVAPGASAWVNPDPVRRTVLNGALRVWIDYDLEEDCEPCHERVLAAVTRGVREVTATEIVFRTLSPLEDTGAAEIVLEVRSRYFHPSSRSLRSQPVLLLAEDGGSYPVGPIYPAGEGEEGAPLFEYRLKLVMPDGRLLGGERWLPASGLYQPIGRVQVEEAAGVAFGSGP